MVVACLSFFSLAGCVVGPDFSSPIAPSVKGYTPQYLASTESARGPGGTSQHFRNGRDVSGAWWRLFHSKQIDAFVEEALANHPDLAAAQATLREAREITAADIGALFPSAMTENSVTRQQVSGGQGGKSSKASIYTLYNTSVPVSFTPDIFGGRARGIEADRANAEYQRFELEATYLSLTSNVVSSAINDASYAAQIRVTQELIAAQRQQVSLLEKQFVLGAVSEADVLLQRALLAQTLATLPPLQKSRALNRNQLMAYLGRFPSDDRGETLALAALHLPRDLPLSLPSELVRQRPDIQAAESQLHQASANIGVATANMLPQLTLSASGGSAAGTFAKLFGAQTTAWSVAASIASPVFDAGSLYHSREAKIAVFDQAEAKYRSTVLLAFQNVADSLRAIEADAAMLRAEVEAEKVSSDSLRISQAQFKAGSTTYLSVLNAQQTLLIARTSRVKAQASRYGDTVALFQSLGGGWWNRIDETRQAQPKPAGLPALFPPAAALDSPAD